MTDTLRIFVDLKRCSRCEQFKPEDEFYSYREKRSGRQRLQAKCKSCQGDVARDWSLRNPYKKRMADARYAARHIRQRKLRTYGLTETELLALEASQQGVCLICHEAVGADALNIDHDHVSGRVRGLLCTLCNCGLGAFRDDPRRLLNAIRYLATSP